MADIKVRYSGKKYNLDEFFLHHPCGKNFIEKYKHKYVDKTMQEINYSDAARYLLNKYSIGEVDDNNNNMYDLEYFIDWSKPILNQFGKLGSKYHEWVAQPVEKEIRLFSDPTLEKLTLAPWYTPLLWLPLTIYLFINGYHKHIQNSEGFFAIPAAVFYIILGLVFRIFLEHKLHRCLVHLRPSGSSKAIIQIHFLIHGLHHKSPFDTRRLVTPLVPAVLTMYCFYQFYRKFFSANIIDLLMCGTILGYVIYDLAHYYIHSKKLPMCIK